MGCSLHKFQSEKTDPPTMTLKTSALDLCRKVEIAPSAYTENRKEECKHEYDEMLTEVELLYEEGIEILKFGDPAEAVVITDEISKEIAAYTISGAENQSLELFLKKIAFMNGQAKCLGILGRTRDAGKMLEETVAALRRILEITNGDTQNLKRHLGRNLVEWSKFLHTQGSLEHALQCALEGLNIFLYVDISSTVSVDPSVARVCLRIAFIYMDKYSYEESLMYYQYAINHFRDFVEVDQDSYAMELASSLGYMAQCFSRAALSLKCMQSVVEALHWYELSSRRKSDGEKQLIVDGLLGHAHSLWNSGNPEVALQCNQLAVDIRRQFSIGITKDAKFAMSLRGLSRCQYETGRQEGRKDHVVGALQSIKEAIAIHLSFDQSSIHTKKSLAYDLAYMVKILLSMGRFSDALWPAQQAASLYRELAKTESTEKNYQVLICALRQLGDIYQAQGDLRSLNAIHADIEKCKSRDRMSNEGLAVSTSDLRAEIRCSDYSSATMKLNDTLPYLHLALIPPFIFFISTVLPHLLFCLARICSIAIAIFCIKLVALWCVCKFRL